MSEVRVNPARQRGASLWGIMLLVGMLGLLLTMALKIAPAYFANGTIANAVEGVIANNDIKTMPIGEIRNEVMRTVRTNRIEGFNSADIKVVRENNVDYIDINYETRVRLFYNIDAVVMFENRFNKF
ncbi:MAG: DUF4845 domain-containing protein [Pseudomonadota bacterium]